MTVLRLIAATAVIAAALYAGEAAAQSNGQHLRAKNAAAQQGAKRSFELDLGKMTAKHPQAQRTAGKAQAEWKKNHRTRNVKKTQGKKSMTRDQKNFGTLNR